MADRIRYKKFGALLLASAFLVLVLIPAALAQDEPAPEDQPTITETAPQPAPPPKPAANAGPFSKGKVRVGFYAGAGNTYNQTYAIVGAGIGYYLMNGLEVGIDGEGWVLNDPTIWKVTPQVRYVIWQMEPIRPYVGAFWRKTLVTGFPDYDSVGARAGVAYQKGGNYLAVGAVYEKFNDYEGLGDDYTIYPEIALWISF